MDLGLSPRVSELRDKVADMIENEVLPVEHEFLEEVRKKVYLLNRKLLDETGLGID